MQGRRMQIIICFAGDGVLQDALDACLKSGMLQESDPVVVVQQMVHKLDAWVSFCLCTGNCTCSIIDFSSNLTYFARPFQKNADVIGIMSFAHLQCFA